MERKGLTLISASALCSLFLFSYPLFSPASAESTLAIMAYNNKPFATYSDNNKHEKLENVVDLAPAKGDLKSVQVTFEKTTYRPRASLGPFYQSRSNSFGLYDLFLPYTISTKAIVFADGRYYEREKNAWEYNAGIGLREITDSGNYLWTVYGFYDDRKTRFGNKFSQITVGADFQSNKWYFDTNGYIPTGSREAFVSAFNTAFLCSGNSRICYARGIERSMGGWDAEFGYTFWRNVRAYAGMYVFAADRVKTAVGPNLRLQYDITEAHRRIFSIFDKISLIANWRDDALSGSIWYAGARFDITLGKRPPDVGLERRMTSFIRRDLNVEMSSDGNGSNAAATEPARILRNEFDGQQTQVALVNTGITNGAFDAIVANARNNIIGVRGNATVTGVKTMQGNQVLEGGVFSFTREGQDFMVQVGQNGLITRGAAGFDLVSFVNTAPNLTVENMAFNNVGAAVAESAIEIGGGVTAYGNIIIRNNTETGDAQFFRFLPLVGLVAGTNNLVLQNNVTSGVIPGNNPAVFMRGGGPGSNTVALVDRNRFTTTSAAEILNIGNSLNGHLIATVTNNFLQNAGPTIGDATFIAGFSNVGTVTFTNITGNTIINTAAGAADASIAMALLNNVYVQGDISNNSFTGAGNTIAGGVVDINLVAGGFPKSIVIDGAFRNNTVTKTGTSAGQAVLVNTGIGVSDMVISIAGGFLNNTIAAGTRTGLFMTNTVRAQATTINGIIGNSFTGFAFGSAIVTVIAGGMVTILTDRPVALTGAGIASLNTNGTTGGALVAGNLTLGLGTRIYP